MKKLVYLIVNKAWEFMLGFQDAVNFENEVTLYIDEEGRTLSWIWSGDKQREIIMGKGKGAVEVNELMKKWVTEILENKEYSLGKVFLYTCGDNALISLDPMKEEDFKKATGGGGYEKEKGFRGKLFIGYD